MAEIFRKALNNDDITNIKNKLAIPGAPEDLAKAFRTPKARDVKVKDDDTGVVYTFRCRMKPSPVFDEGWRHFAGTKNFKDGDTIVLYRADGIDSESGAEYKIEVRRRN